MTITTCLIMVGETCYCSDCTRLPPEDCIEFGEQCKGTVVARMSLSGTGTPIERCDHHWSKRLDLQDRLRRDYPDSSTPPSWFDPTYAGESWNED